MARIALPSGLKEGGRSSWVRRVVVGIFAGLIFLTGVGVGNGNISFRTQNPNTSLPDSLNFSSVEQVYDALKASFDGKLDERELTDGMKRGLTQSTNDPYTEYLNPEEAKEFTSELSGTFTGIGAELSKDIESKSIVIVAPLSGYPAEKAGIRPKDVVASIDDKSAFDITVTEAVKRIRGAEGTKVKLTIIRDKSQELKFEIERAKITVPSVESKILEGQIGYIKVSSFGDDTTELTQKAAKSLKEANVHGVILDLRGNPGGYLESAVDVSSLWLSNKTVVEERRSGVTTKTFRSRGTPILEGVPTIVLINEGSASASEITAGALRDNGAATLLGQKSFGKGSVQQPTTLANGGIIKITVARWFTPKGKNIDKEGLEPDKKVDRTDDDYKNNRDPQLDAATQQLRQQ